MTDYRLTGEVLHRSPDPNSPNEIGTGEKIVLLRDEHGNKAGWVGSDLLELVGIDPTEIMNGETLPPEKQVTITVDLA
jgi:hypothetical protein